MKHGTLRQLFLLKDRSPLSIIVPRRDKEVADCLVSDVMYPRCPEVDGVGSEEQSAPRKPWLLKDRFTVVGVTKRAELDGVLSAICESLVAEVVPVTTEIEIEAAWVAKRDLVWKSMTGLDFNDSDLALVSSSKP